MFRKCIATGIACSILLLPMTGFASPRHHDHHGHRYEHRGNHRHYRHHSRSLHRGDYAVIAAGVVIGAILAR